MTQQATADITTEQGRFLAAQIARSVDTAGEFNRIKFHREVSFGAKIAGPQFKVAVAQELARRAALHVVDHIDAEECKRLLQDPGSLKPASGPEGADSENPTVFTSAVSTLSLGLILLDARRATRAGITTFCACLLENSDRADSTLLLRNANNELVMQLKQAVGNICVGTTGTPSAYREDVIEALSGMSDEDGMDVHRRRARNVENEVPEVAPTPADVGYVISDQDRSRIMGADWASLHGKSLSSIVNGPLDYLQELLTNGVDVNVQDEQGNTLLHLAARFNKIAACQVLLDAGADPNIANANGANASSYIALFESLGFLRAGHHKPDFGGALTTRRTDPQLVSDAGGAPQPKS